MARTLSQATLIHLRSALLMTLRAIDAALLESYGWTPRRSTPDVDPLCYNERDR